MASRSAYVEDATDDTEMGGVDLASIRTFSINPLWTLKVVCLTGDLYK